MIRAYVRWNREKVAEVLRLRAEGMEYSEIAERWGMSAGSLRAIYSRHRRKYAADDAAQEAAQDDA